MDSDNGPPYSGRGSKTLASTWVFNHEHKTLRNPQAKGEAEQFMRVGKKLYTEFPGSAGQNFKQEIQRFLRCYRATPHLTANPAPAERKVRGRKLPTGILVRLIPIQLDFEEPYQRDLEKKCR